MSFVSGLSLNRCKITSYNSKLQIFATTQKGRNDSLLVNCNRFVAFLLLMANEKLLFSIYLLHFMAFSFFYYRKVVYLHTHLLCTIVAFSAK